MSGEEIAHENLICGITGAARGVGLGYVKALLGRGYHVAMFDISDNVLDCVIELSQAFPASQVRGYVVDVSNFQEFQLVYRRSLDDFQSTQYDVFVNNAGILRPFFVDVEAVIQTNLQASIRGTELAIRSATKSMSQKSNRPLVVVCTASTNGLIPADCDVAPVYVASKFGLVGFVRSLKILKERYDVRVNAICPVCVNTPMFTDWIPEGDTTVFDFVSSNNRGGVLEPSDCAAVLLRIIDDTSLAGDVLSVHPAAGPDGKLVPLDPSGELAYLGRWREDECIVVKGYVDQAVTAVKDGAMSAFS